jgi:hypothetical protein
VKAAAAWCAQTLCQLEPNNPKTLVGTATALRVDLTVRSYKQAAQSFLRAFELAQQQRSDFWSAHSAASATCLATYHPFEVGHSTLAAAVAAFEQTAEAALRRCKHLLPEVWVRPLATTVEVARPLLPGAHKQLRLLLQQGSNSSRAASAALQASSVAQAAAVNEHAHKIGLRHFCAAQTTQCDGCGQEAVGLRRCARCKKAQYCRCVRVLLPGRCLHSVLSTRMACPVGTAGRVGLPACRVVSFAPLDLPPGAAGSARQRTGLPTSAGAAPPDSSSSMAVQLPVEGGRQPPYGACLHHTAADPDNQPPASRCFSFSAPRLPIYPRLHLKLHSASALTAAPARQMHGWYCWLPGVPAGPLDACHAQQTLRPVIKRPAEPGNPRGPRAEARGKEAGVQGTPQRQRWGF